MKNPTMNQALEIDPHGRRSRNRMVTLLAMTLALGVLMATGTASAQGKDPGTRTFLYGEGGVGAVGSSSQGNNLDLGMHAGLGLRVVLPDAESWMLGAGLNMLVVNEEGVTTKNADGTTTTSNGGLNISGMSADGRFYLKLGKVTPYASLGLGLHDFGTGANNWDPTVDLGLGSDFWLSKSMKAGVRFVHHSYLDQPASAANQPDPIQDFWMASAMMSFKF